MSCFQVELLLDGKVLENDKSLGDYKIKAGMKMVLRKPPGV